MKLTIEEHLDLGMHFHAIDHHLTKMIRIVIANGRSKVPDELLSGLEDLKETLGATSSPSGHYVNSLPHKFEELLYAEHPESTLDVYHGSYADCVTSRMLDPRTPAE